MDLNKLSPAPWLACGEGVCCGLYAEPQHHLIFDPDGTWADTQFCALARNALDVMVRRGWYTVPYEREPNETWIAMNTFCCKIERGGNTGTYFVASDPFSCLVEADEWHRNHFENKSKQESS